MVRSVFNARGHYIGHIWGGFDLSHKTGEFRGRAMGQRTHLGPFVTVEAAQAAVHRDYEKTEAGIFQKNSPPAPRQLNLGL